MIFRIAASVLLVISISAMDNPESKKASEGLFKLMAEAYNRAHNRTFNALIGQPDKPFDHSQQGILVQVKSFLDQGADPTYSLFFKVPMPGSVGMQLPNSVWLAQELEYQEILDLFSTQRLK